MGYTVLRSILVTPSQRSGVTAQSHWDAKYCRSLVLIKLGVYIYSTVRAISKVAQDVLIEEELRTLVIN